MLLLIASGSSASLSLSYLLLSNVWNNSKNSSAGQVLFAMKHILSSLLCFFPLVSLFSDCWHNTSCPSAASEHNKGVTIKAEDNYGGGVYVCCSWLSWELLIEFLCCQSTLTRHCLSIKRKCSNKVRCGEPCWSPCWRKGHRVSPLPNAWNRWAKMREKQKIKLLIRPFPPFEPISLHSLDMIRLPPTSGPRIQRHLLNLKSIHMSKSLSSANSSHKSMDGWASSFLPFFFFSAVFLFVSHSISAFPSGKINHLAAGPKLMLDFCYYCVSHLILIPISWKAIFKAFEALSRFKSTHQQLW